MAWPTRRPDFALWPVLPFSIALLLVFVSSAPTHVPALTDIAPDLPLVALFYWSIFSRATLGLAGAAVLGLINDVLAGTPLGLSSIVYLTIHGICASQRRFFLGKPFHLAWWGFCVIVIMAQALAWFLASAVAGQVLPALPSFFAGLMTMAVYPPLSWIFARLQLALIDG